MTRKERIELANKIYEMSKDEFKKENNNLIETLVKKKSKILLRFKAVFIVVDYLYDEMKKRKLSEDEEYIFSSGYDFLYDEFETIKSLLHEYFNDNINRMEMCSQTINLLLLVEEVKGEVLNTDKIKNEVKRLNDLEDKIYDYLKKGEDAPDEYFEVVDEITDDIFDKNEIEVNLIEEIFYEIALEYDIYPEDDTNYVNDFMRWYVDLNLIDKLSFVLQL